MDPKRSGGMLLAAPHGGAPELARLPPARAFPPLEQPIVKPETREEIVRGRRLEAMPALPPHGDQHFKLDYILGAHVKPDYIGSTDLLTRPSVGSNFATDTCVRRAGIDPVTEERYLEELSFEVVNEQSRRDITERAEDLVARGVRRVFAIFVKKGQISEWSAKDNDWKELAASATIDDAALARPLHVKELLDAAEASNAVARGLLAQGNPVLVEAKAESRREGLEAGEKQGLQGVITRVCARFGIELTPERLTQISDLDAAGLSVLLEQLSVDRRWP